MLQLLYKCKIWPYFTFWGIKLLLSNFWKKSFSWLMLQQNLLKMGKNNFYANESFCGIRSDIFLALYTPRNSRNLLKLILWSTFVMNLNFISCHENGDIIFDLVNFKIPPKNQISLKIDQSNGRLWPRDIRKIPNWWL